MDPMKLSYTRRKTPAELAAEKARPTLISKLKKLTPQNIMFKIIADKIRPFLQSWVPTLAGLITMLTGLLPVLQEVLDLATTGVFEVENAKAGWQQIVIGGGLLWARQQGK
jgi:hypothetical protein